MPPRFYCPELATPGPIELAETEAHHLAHVMRLSAGEPIEVFNGKGCVGQAVVGRVGKRAVGCDVLSVVQLPLPSPKLTLGTAVPKGDRFDWLVEKATELGVFRLVPLRTARGTVEPRETKLERLRHAIVAACKQSRRAHLMELAPVMDWREFIDQARGGDLMVAHPGGPVISTIAENLPISATQFAAAVGPEGGFTEEEIALALQQGGHLVGLGGNVLRIETAGLLLAGWSLIRQQRCGEA